MATTTLDSIDIANLLAQELLFQQLVSSLDGLHSGVPTRTTPTLTPTTLRTIEQTFLEFTSEPASHSREAGFVPPLIEPSQPTPAQTQNNGGGVVVLGVVNAHHEQQQQPQQQQQHQQQQQQQQALLHNGGNVLLESTQTPRQQQQQQQPQNSPTALQQEQQQQQQPTTARRNMGGRRPTRTIGMSPEEEERRQIRRERNKMAAARCRKRRMDHTNALLEETEDLEQKKQNLQDEIQQLQHTREELELMLEAHRAVCRLQSSSPPDIKPIIPGGGSPNPGNELHQSEEFSEINCVVVKNHQQQQQHQHQQPQLQQQQQQQQHEDSSSMNGLRPNRPNSLPVGYDNNNQRPTSLPIFTEPKPRPSSLQFKTVETPAFMKTSSEVAGIPITTPSSGIPFNFDSLMEGGTGLTPVSTPLVPSCSSQHQRSSSGGGNGASAAGNHLHSHHHQQQQQQQHHLGAVDLSSPDANPPKLVSL